MPQQRSVQLAYSEIQSRMLDAEGRRQKAAKILSVLGHFLGRDDLTGLVVLDLGTSAGFIASELARAGGRVIGVDIDEPGLAKARDRFGDEADFISASSDKLPIRTAGVDVIVFNHVYEHVLDADAAMSEIRRVLRPEGVVFLGLGNRLGVIEPHYKLPFLSWLTPGLADRYVRMAKKADAYHERFRTRRGLRRMVDGLSIWDYTFAVLADPDRFNARDMVPEVARKVPVGVYTTLVNLLPTYLWVGSPAATGPRGAALTVQPVPVTTLPLQH